MYQAGYYPSKLAYSYPNPPYPQYRDPYGAAPPGYPYFPPQAPDPEFEYRKENPCRCCCGLITAARTLAILNLLYLGLEVLSATDNKSQIMIWSRFLDMILNYSGFMGPGLDYNKEKHFLYHCTEPETRDRDGFYFGLFSCILIYLVATMGFMVAVFGSPGTKAELLCSNLFILIGFCYIVSSRVLFSIDMGNTGEDCRAYWDKFIILAVGITVFWVFCALVAWGFGKMVQRRSKLKQDINVLALTEAILSLRTDEDEDPEVLDSSSRSGAESIPQPL